MTYGRRSFSINRVGDVLVAAGGNGGGDPSPSTVWGMYSWLQKVRGGGPSPWRLPLGGAEATLRLSN